MCAGAFFGFRKPGRFRKFSAGLDAFADFRLATRARSTSTSPRPRRSPRGIARASLHVSLFHCSSSSRVTIDRSPRAPSSATHATDRPTHRQPRDATPRHPSGSPGCLLSAPIETSCDGAEKLSAQGSRCAPDNSPNARPARVGGPQPARGRQHLLGRGGQQPRIRFAVRGSGPTVSSRPRRSRRLSSFDVCPRRAGRRPARFAVFKRGAAAIAPEYACGPVGDAARRRGRLDSRRDPRCDTAAPRKPSTMA